MHDLSFFGGWGWGGSILRKLKNKVIITCKIDDRFSMFCLQVMFVGEMIWCTSSHFLMVRNGQQEVLQCPQFSTNQGRCTLM